MPGNHGEYDDNNREKGSKGASNFKYDNTYHVLVKRAKKIDDSNTSIMHDSTRHFDVVDSPSSIKENLD